MQPLWRLTVCLGCLWIASLLYVELIAFWIPRWSCSWPDLQQKFASTRAAEHRPVKVVLIADPQLTDRTSYGMAPGSLVLKIGQFYSDIYMRRAFRSSVLGLEPDEIIILGNHFDGGPYLSDDEWMESLRRFEHIFDQSQRGLKLKSKSEISVHHLAGNHDLGYHEHFSEKHQILERYKEVFGDTDYSHKVGGVEFVVVNAQALDGDKNDSSSNRSWSFVEQIGASDSDSSHDPRILLTHIPLYRPDDAPCGSPVINQRLKKTNWSRITLTNETSLKLLDLTKPVMVFSGHDHDQCKTLHSTTKGVYPEYTVGTFSWQQGNLYPSFMMLSVASHSSAMTDAIVSENLCFLPAQGFNYAWYAVLFLISVLALLFWPSQGIDLLAALLQFYNAVKGSGSMKEKDEDADWEMMWDAEGGMHLIKKSIPQTATQHSQSTERRGTAVQRAAAKSRTSNLAEDFPDADSANNLPSTNKGRMSSIRRRLYQIFGPLTVLVAVNFSLYMMLLVTDWA